MAALHRISCPHCGATLKSNKGVRVGKQIQCLKCQAPFTLSAADGGLGGGGEPPDNGADPDLVLAEPNGDRATSGGPQATEERPRVGILEPRREAVTATARPLPQPVSTAVPTAAPFAPSSSRASGKAVLAWCALALLLAGGAFVAYLCLSGTPADDERPVSARSDKDGRPVPVPAPERSEAPGPSPAPSPAADAPARAADPKDRAPPGSAPASAPESRPPPKAPKQEPPLVRRTPRDVLPATPLVKVTKSNAKPHAEQKRIDEAVERGVAFLRTRQADSGSWDLGQHGVGYAALPGLTLLECGAKASDPAVQAAARFVRQHIADLQETYDLGLAILFLDRLGESADHELIQNLALRVVAGQTALGGWDYHCPMLTAEQSRQLLTYLLKHRPPLLNPLGKDGTGASKNPLPGKATARQRGAGNDAADMGLPDFIRNLPIHHRKANGDLRKLNYVRDDNSNSQFALLALWAARRHDVPTELTLALAEERYRAFHNPDGGWGYMIRTLSTEAMTCVGLLGLGVGHGASEDGLAAAANQRNNLPAPRLAKQDPAIKKGLRALGTAIGKPHKSHFIPPMTNLYFLWSLERVAMLYNLDTIGGNDWYSWGVSILLPNQQTNGSWFSTPYPGQNPTIDTCFALLFLKRSNLVQDLTDNLMLYLAITDPGARK